LISIDGGEESTAEKIRRWRSGEEESISINGEEE
jgi:hypothetical protein